jgi:hypothetical protein
MAIGYSEKSLLTGSFSRIVFVIIVFNLILMGAFLFIGSPALALDPDDEVMSCFDGAEVSSRGNSCEVIMCEWRNIQYNWPKNTGYKEDCNRDLTYENNPNSTSSGSDSTSLDGQRVVFFSAIAVLIGALSLIYISRKDKKH